jgi:hypothetical protein
MIGAPIVRIGDRAMKIPVEIAFVGEMKEEVSLNLDSSASVLEMMYHLWDSGREISSVSIGSSVIANEALIRVATLPDAHARAWISMLCDN